MTDTSARLGLVLPTQVDPFSTADVYDNWNKIDAAPGSHICTSTTRPSTWGAAQAGRKIIETDTGLEWWWNGTTFKRLQGLGLLKRTDGTPAISERTTAFTSASTTYVVVQSLTNVVVPSGSRPLRIDAQWMSTTNTAGAFSMALFQSNVANSGAMLAHWNSSNNGADTAGGGVFFAVIRAGLAAGTYNFSLQIHSAGAGGTSGVQGDATQPITVTASEM